MAPATSRPIPESDPTGEHRAQERRDGALAVEQDDPSDDREDDSETLPHAALELRRRAEPVSPDDFLVHVRLDPPQRAGEGVLQVRERDDVPSGAEDAVEEPALVGQQCVIGRRAEMDEGPVGPA